MRHATQSQRLSMPSDRRQAVVNALVKNLVLHGQIRTTYARAKAAQRLADRLVTLGKDGSIHSRRRAFRILQDRGLVKQLFSEIAPRYVDLSGGYTRVLRLSPRPGDGAEQALLAMSRLPAGEPAASSGPKPERAPQAPTEPKRPHAEPSKAEEKPKTFFEGIRNIWTRKKKGSAAA
ncbi:MAG: 50S ribosomal protein L17 [Candidatus Omnitrophica bacterium]|nr:50S ribosomal protein L17 [Candidatus Omnitrophota bacterium]